MVSKIYRVSGGFYLFAALLLLFLPLPWTGAIFFAGFVHELGHYLAIRVLTGRGAQVRIYSYAAQMPLPEMARWKELVCAMAGPAAGFCLLLTARWLPRAAVIALGQSIYNLMPIYPLDGGRALQCVLDIALPPKTAVYIGNGVANICRCILIILSIYASFRFSLGILPIVFVCMVLFRTK